MTFKTVSLFTFSTMFLVPIFVSAVGFPRVIVQANGIRYWVEVPSGGQVRITWNSENATGCTETVTDYATDNVIETRQVGANVSRGDGIRVESSRKYTIECSNLDGVRMQDAVVVIVKPRSPIHYPPARRLQADSAPA